MIRRFAEPGAVERAFAELGAHWRGLASRFRLECGDARLERMANTWNPYQCLATFNLGRSASLFESGIGRGLGFRDTNQDLLGCVHQVPERARRRILEVASTQKEDGSAYHQYQPLTRRGNANIGGDFNDDPLWLILSASAYLKESGDWGILEEQVPFDHDPARAGNLFEHLRRSFQHVVANRGPHGLPLIGRADWNDCLNLNCFSTDPDESFQTTANRDGRVAESVLIAGMFVFIGREFAEICRRTGRGELAEEAEAGHPGHGAGRTGARLGRGVVPAGLRRGRSADRQRRLRGGAHLHRAAGLLRHGRDRPGEGLPAPSPGRGERAPGLRPGPGAALARLLPLPPEPGGDLLLPGGLQGERRRVLPQQSLGHDRGGPPRAGERAFEYYRKICPSYQEQAELHRTEPYVYAQMIAGRQAARPGEAKNSWLTGTAAWNFVALSQWILGIRPEYDGLRIDPCIPPDWEGFTVERAFRGSRYRIRVANPQHVSRGVVSLRVDGREVAGNLVPPAGGGLHAVEAVLGLAGGEG